MTNKPSLFAAIGAALLATPVALPAAPLGQDARACTSGGPAILVRVNGLKNRIGRVRVRAFTGNPSTYFTKGREVGWIEVPIPAVGPVEICVAAKPGVYAVDVRHDANVNRKTDFSDGAGISGNPKVSVLDVVLKRRPPAQQVQFRVGNGVSVVPVQVRYKG